MNIKSRVEELQDGKLLEMIGVGSGDYTTETIAAAKEELEKRSFVVEETSENGALTFKDLLLKTNYSRIENVLKQKDNSKFEAYDFNGLYFELLKIHSIESGKQLRLTHTFIESTQVYSDEDVVAVEGEDIYNPGLMQWAQWLGCVVDEEQLTQDKVPYFVALCLLKMAKGHERITGNAVQYEKQETVEMVQAEDLSKDRWVPWRRYFARRFDYVLLAIILELVYWSVPEIFQNTYWMWVWISEVVILWMIIESIIVSKWGCTLGKLIFGLEVQSSDGTKLRYLQSLKRSIGVGLLGVGLGVFLLSILCNLSGYHTLGESGTTYWDRYAGTVVKYKPANRDQLIAGIALTVLLAFVNTTAIFNLFK